MPLVHLIQKNPKTSEKQLSKGSKRASRMLLQVLTAEKTSATATMPTTPTLLLINDE